MGWFNPMVGMVTDEDPVITFALPIPGRDRKTACVVGVDVSLRLLSKIVQAAKPSDNSYCTLLDGDGAFIVHPDGHKLLYQTALMSSDPQAKEAAKAMMSGETGYKPFRLSGTDYYIFYKPFKRTAVPGSEAESTGWSAGVIYPENDVFGNYNNLLYYVLAITFVSLLLVFLLCRLVIHRQLTPLTMLSRKARRIAEGNYDEPIPATKQKDEIGRLQDNFRHMQQSLAAHIDELEKLKETLKIHSVDLREAYAQARQADSMKTAFLHNMTNQMTAPAEKIRENVQILSDSSQIKKQEARQLVEIIQEKGNFIAELLNNLLRVSNDMGKEASHD
jgi:methyl-accepting chemotaxis protein